MANSNSILCTTIFISAAAAALAQTLPPPELEAALRHAAPGDQLSLGFGSIAAIPALNAPPNILKTTGGPLLYSDDPESAEATGILYQDTFPAGPCRVYLYHTNATDAVTRFSVVISNPATDQLTITPGKSIIGPVTEEYVICGREASRAWYEEPNTLDPFTIPPGGSMILDAKLDAIKVQKDELVHSMHDIEANGPFTVSTVMVGEDADTEAVFKTLEFSPDDGHLREGTFPGWQREDPSPYSYDTADGICRIRIADGKNGVTDPPLKGTDAQSTEEAFLWGNYGVTYEVDINVTNSAGKNLAVLLNPRGGDYGGYVRTTFGEQTTGTLVPADAQTIPPTTEAGVCALLTPSEEEMPLRLELIPAGASSLAIDLMLVPYSEE